MRDSFSGLRPDLFSHLSWIRFRGDDHDLIAERTNAGQPATSPSRQGRYSAVRASEPRELLRWELTGSSAYHQSSRITIRNYRGRCSEDFAYSMYNSAVAQHLRGNKMQGNQIAAMVVLIAGVWIVANLTRMKSNSKKSMWLSLAALVAGPVIAFGLWAIDVMIVNSEFYPVPFAGDGLATLTRVLAIGAVVGLVVALSVSIATHVKNKQEPN